MAGFLGFVGVLVGLGLILLALWWFAGWARRRGIGRSLMTPFQMLWHPGALDFESDLTSRRARSEGEVAGEAERGEEEP